MPKFRVPYRRTVEGEAIVHADYVEDALRVVTERIAEHANPDVETTLGVDVRYYDIEEVAA